MEAVQVKCPHCNTSRLPKKSAAVPWGAVFAGAIVSISFAIFIYLILNPQVKIEEKKAVTHLDAITNCQMALKRVSRDPNNADIPYVDDQGGASSFLYVWGPSTRMARFRNGIGLDVSSGALCEVDKESGKIIMLMIGADRFV